MAGTANHGIVAAMIKMPFFSSEKSAAVSAAAITAAMDLVRDHLCAALDHCDAIAASSMQLGASVSSGAAGRVILRQNRHVLHFVADLRARELAIALRLTQAGIVAERAAGLSSATAAISALVKSGGTVLVDAGTRIAAEAQDVSTFAYLAERGLLDDDATELPEQITCGGYFVVLGAMPLADVRAFLDAALRAVDAL
jgi:hypothetical protein